MRVSFPFRVDKETRETIKKMGGSAYLRCLVADDFNRIARAHRGGYDEANWEEKARIADRDAVPLRGEGD